MVIAIALTLTGVAAAAEVSPGAEGHAFNPTWSRDGKHLAFEVNQYEGSVDLYVVEVMNGNPVGKAQKVTVPGSTSNFAAKGSMAAAPTWHPEGSLIFEGSSSGGSNRLYHYQPGGQKASELLNTGQIGGDLSWPNISSDGSVLAFVSDATGAGDMYTWNTATNKVELAISSPFSEMAPRIGTGGEIAYSRKNRGGEDLFVWSNNASTPRVGGNGDQTRPAWVGPQLAFFTNERGEGHWDIAVSTAAGDKKIIAKDVRLPLRAAPAVSPDGKWVAYGVQNPDQYRSVMVTTADGSRTLEIPTGMIAAGEPSMVQVGGRVFLAFTALPNDNAAWRQLHIIDVTEKLK